MVRPLDTAGAPRADTVGALSIGDADVVSMMDVADAVRPREAGLLAETRCAAENMTKTHLAWGGSNEARRRTFATEEKP